MNLCFLDFDGVLNSDAYFAENPRVHGDKNLDPILIARLCDFLETTDCKVVVSSTWRINTPVKELREILCRRGFRDESRVIGKTPRLGGSPRGKEIRSYLKKHPKASFVIFDDDDDMDSVESHFVHTDPRVGLSVANVRQAEQILKTKGSLL